jgi:tRNA C32,U32 (ribose-2'-O)-methylase TrmJ
MVRNLRNMFQRMAPTESEINTLHGVVVALRGKKGGGKKGAPRKSGGN